MAATPEDKPETETGIIARVVVLFPIWPLPLSPQQRTPPPVVSAQEKKYPDVMAFMPDDSPDTSTGKGLFVIELFPNCPLLFKPQHLTAVIGSPTFDPTA